MSGFVFFSEILFVICDTLHLTKQKTEALNDTKTLDGLKNAVYEELLENKNIARTQHEIFSTISFIS